MNGLVLRHVKRRDLGPGRGKKREGLRDLDLGRQSRLHSDACQVDDLLLRLDIVSSDEEPLLGCANVNEIPRHFG